MVIKKCSTKTTSEFSWNLSILYPSFSSDEFLGDINQYKSSRDSIFALIERWENSCQYIEKVLNEIEGLIKVYSELSSYVNLNLMINCNNSEAKKYYEKIVEMQSDINEIKRNLYDKIDTDLYTKTDCLRKYEFFFKDIEYVRKHLMTPEAEKIAADLRKSGSYAWQALRDYIDGNAKGKICIDGKEEMYSLYEIRNLSSDINSNVRKEAYNSEMNIYKDIEEYATACFNGVKGDAVSMYRPRGFSSVLDNMLFVNKMDIETLNAMNRAIKDYLPSFHEFYKTKARIFGKNKLCYYDLTAPIGKFESKYSFEKCEEILIKAFLDVDEDLGNFVFKAFKEKWFDAFPKEGKLGGALCADLPTKNRSMIFLNYSQNFTNIRTCAHELGHAYHGYCLKDVPLFLRDAPTPICETASIFNETLFQQKFMEKKDNDMLAMLELSLSETSQTVVDIYSRFLFEDRVFKIRETRSLFTEEIKNLMCEAQLEAYGDSIDENSLHPYMWICKPHYYITDYHYYNFPYIFGLLFAKGLYAIYENNKDNFFDNYRTFLSNTCNGNICQMAKNINIDIHDYNFWSSSLETIKKDIDLFIKLAK